MTASAVILYVENFQTPGALSNQIEREVPGWTGPGPTAEGSTGFRSDARSPADPGWQDRGFDPTPALFTYGEYTYTLATPQSGPIFWGFDYQDGGFTAGAITLNKIAGLMTTSGTDVVNFFGQMTRTPGADGVERTLDDLGSQRIALAGSGIPVLHTPELWTQALTQSRDLYERTVRIVIGYDPVAGTASLWLNPPLAEATAPTLTVGALTGQTVTGLRFIDDSRDILGDGPRATVNPMYDNFVIATTLAEAIVIPEPSTIGLLLVVGLAAGAIWLWRRRRLAAVAALAAATAVSSGQGQDYRMYDYRILPVGVAPGWDDTTQIRGGAETGGAR